MKIVPISLSKWPTEILRNCWRYLCKWPTEMHILKCIIIFIIQSVYYVYTDRIMNIIMHLYKYHVCIPTIHKVREDVVISKRNY